MRTPGWNRREVFAYVFSRKFALRLTQVAITVVITFLISSWLFRSVPEGREEQASINLYLQEHQSAIVQSISTELLTQPAARMFIGRDDVLYFEYIEDFPPVARPSLIIKGPLTKQTIAMTKAPTISRGRIIEQSQVKDLVDYEPIILEHLPNGYVLSSIRMINETDCIHLLYTKELETASFFQQPSYSKNGLSAQDFRDYAILLSKDPEADSNIKGRGTILAWSNGERSYVLIGDADLPELMDMVQSINQASK